MTAGPSPCGADCGACARFPSACSGCRDIAGKVRWLRFTGADRCAVYDCCVNRKGRPHCGNRPALSYERCAKYPTISDEENAAHLQTMLENLKKLQ